MKIPNIRGVIKRRVLLNYRVEPQVIQQVLPANFRPKLHKDYAIAGICLIRLEGILPSFMPDALSFISMNSENSAHRIAVEWDSADGVKEGVFVPRRDTDSRINSLAGGRIFPGVHHHSEFIVDDADGEISIAVKSDEAMLLEMSGSETDDFPADSVFDSLEETSVFFEKGCVGYSSRPNSPVLDGLQLKVTDWKVSALMIKNVVSSYFDDRSLFPEGSIEFDHALLMRDIDHEWHSEPEMRLLD